MYNIQIIQLSSTFNSQYEAKTGLTYDALLDATTNAYIDLWEEKYEGNPDIDKMRDAEHINFIDARAAIAAFALSSTTETDSLQSGNGKAMYIAIDKDTKEVEGLIQISNFNFAKFAQQRLEALQKVHEKVNEYTGSTDDMETALSHVCKPQREYHSDNVIGAALMKAALSGTQATSAFIVSYDGAESKLGYKNVTATTTMDSDTPCFFMVGKNETVIVQLEEQISNSDAQHEFEYSTLSI